MSENQQQKTVTLEQVLDASPVGKHIENICERQHDLLREDMAERGLHSPVYCPQLPAHEKPSRVLFRKAHCANCRIGMLPWADLPQEMQEAERKRVKKVLQAADEV